MTDSAKLIDDRQDRWGADLPRDPKWQRYAAGLESNLFLKRLHPDTAKEFESGDGSEWKDGHTRPAKMRALASSSALAVNFFDAWRDADKRPLARALGLSSGIAALSFEFKTGDYPVRPRSPNLDLMLRLNDGQAVAVESKFSEPYRSADGFSALSSRYFPPGAPLWTTAHLPAAQRIADRLQPEWIHLDVPQLLKHLLGLASDPTEPGTLLYLWFDTGNPDANAHRREIERFTDSLVSDSVNFTATTYQGIFDTLRQSDEPVAGWHRYMAQRYFAAPDAV